MNSVFLVVAGAVYVGVVIAVTRVAVRRVARFIPRVREDFVYAFVLASTAAQYVLWARSGGVPAAVAIEWAGVTLFGSLALGGLRWPMALAGGWMLHAIWDSALHPMPATVWVPAWFPDFCVGFDIPLAVYIAMRAGARVPMAAGPKIVRVAVVALAAQIICPPAARAQDAPHVHLHPDAAADAPAEPQPAARPAFISAILHHAGSGTSVEPPASPIPMLMGHGGAWRWMVHGSLFIADVEQNSPAGEDKVLSNNWLMPMVGRKLGPGLFAARTMLSLEPATSRFDVAPEPYQAAHDLFMEIAATYDLPLSTNLLLSFYGAPVGEPALGPSAFMHRLSASENIVLPLSHATQDATHQSRDVLTSGVTYKQLRAEVSGFHGRRPDADRIAIEQGPIDSWSARVTASPARNWTLQASAGRLTSPDAAAPSQDVRRVIASVAYTRPVPGGFWASTIAWGRDRKLGTVDHYDSYLAESTVKTAGGHILWGRVETADRSVSSHVGGMHRQEIDAVQSYSAGYAREVRVAPYLETAVGAQVTSYKTPDLIAPVYGARPTAVSVFVRVRPNAH